MAERQGRALPSMCIVLGTSFPAPHKIILKREISLSTYTYFKRTSPEKAVLGFLFFVFCLAENQVKIGSQLKRKVIHRKDWRSITITRRTLCPAPAELCSPASDLVGATASPRGGLRVPAGQHPGSQAVSGARIHGPASACLKELRVSPPAESCAPKPVLSWAAAPAVAGRRGGFAEASGKGGQSPPIIRSSAAKGLAPSHQELRASFSHCSLQGIRLFLIFCDSWQCRSSTLREGGLGMREGAEQGWALKEPLCSPVPGEAWGRQEAAQNSATSPLPMAT